MGINGDGMREILDVRIADTENETTWSDLLRDLKRRGLKGVQLVISDDHEGIKAAFNCYFQGASWQRCQVHFTRNVLRLAGKGEKGELHADLRAIFDSQHIETLNYRIDAIIHKWTEKRPAVAEKLDEEIVDTLACFCFPPSHRKRIRTTNCLERFNQEIKRRTRVVRIFPGEQSALRHHHHPGHGADRGVDRKALSRYEPPRRLGASGRRAGGSRPRDDRRGLTLLIAQIEPRVQVTRVTTCQDSPTGVCGRPVP